MTFRIEPPNAWLFARDGTRKLSADAADRWQATGTSVELDNSTATITLDGVSRICQNDSRRAVWEHAKLNGADFRGQGNEPGWHVENRGDDLVLEIKNRPCRDTMSDETFDTTVTVQWRNRVLSGCGQALH